MNIQDTSQHVACHGHLDNKNFVKSGPSFASGKASRQAGSGVQMWRMWRIDRRGRGDQRKSTRVVRKGTTVAGVGSNVFREPAPDRGSGQLAPAKHVSATYPFLFLQCGASGHFRSRFVARASDWPVELALSGPVFRHAPAALALVLTTTQDQQHCPFLQDIPSALFMHFSPATRSTIFDCIDTPVHSGSRPSRPRCDIDLHFAGASMNPSPWRISSVSQLLGVNSNPTMPLRPRTPSRELLDSDLSFRTREVVEYEMLLCSAMSAAPSTNPLSSEGHAISGKGNGVLRKPKPGAGVCRLPSPSCIVAESSPADSARDDISTPRPLVNSHNPAIIFTARAGPVRR
ncbi:hypothetical protein GE09DRAFT_294538 [Coniochaeta sp. 2T2.1]|nr:hypothetical protein GE09DRAFT_294538 [Coniochaeta sp. 2T2.1]